MKLNEMGKAYRTPPGKRWRFATAVTLACVCMAAVATMVLPHHYKSEMKFLVNHERADLLITPAKDQAAASPGEVEEAEVNSEIEVLKSYDILKAVVLDRKLYLRYQRDKNAPPSARSVERAGLRLEKNLTVSAVRKTNVIQVGYRGDDPDSAVAVLEDVGDRYLASHLVAHSAPGTGKFFAEQVDRSAAKLSEARAAITAFHAREQIFSLPEQRDAMVARLDTVNTQLSDLGTQIHTQQARLVETGNQLAAQPERAVTQVRQVQAQTALEQLETTEAQLENHRIELATKFKPTDRLVTEVDQQIASTQAQIARLRADRMTEETTDVNPLHQSMKADASRTVVDLTGLEAERGSLTQTRGDVLSRLESMDKASLELSTLEQQERQAEDSYTLATHHLEEARLAGALDREKLSNVVMIERPVASSIPVSPILPLNLALGLLLGLGISFGPDLMRATRGSGLSAPRRGGPLGIYDSDPMFHPVSGD